jgi:serine/threonine protein kinase/Tol biopolymer transport system component
MPIASGTRFGPYEIIASAGAGGMGEVYRAKDTRLDRIVAVKVLPSELADDPEKRQRLEREARSISTLSHPHICTLHDIGQQNGVDYLVLEYLEGETLEKRLEKGSLSTPEVFRYAIELADALDKAHRRGIIHRDIKPGNIMLTKSGVKLMDFGLAKLKSETAPAADALTEITVGKKLTAEGTILGTFQYMSPEQLEGREADARTDIFAFGEVLYEMVTGRPPFSGKTKTSLIASILSAEPKAMTELVPATPASLDHVVKRCLAKDPDERWQSANDLGAELKWIAEGGPTNSTAALTPVEKFRERTAWFTACALAVALIVTAIWWRNAKPPEQTMYFSASLPFPAHDIAMAPNGHTLAVVAYRESARKNVLWIYELGSQGARNLADTEGATYPFWSPDGRSLAFFADGKLKKVEVSGGPVQTICDAPSGRGGAWNKDGVIVFTPDARLGGGLYQVSAAGGTAARISNPDTSRGEQSHRWPMFLPDGTHYLYMAANFAGQKGVNAIFVGSLGSNEKRFVVDASANAAYAAPGYLLFCRDKDLLAQRFDLRRFALIGEPTTILTEIQYHPQIRRAVYAVSDNGYLVAQTGSGVALSQPLWFDRKGNTVGAVGKPDVYQNVFLAPNGASVAVDKTDMASQNQNSDVWTYELRRESAKRLTFDPSNHAVPVWSPDAARLVFASNRLLNFDLYMKNSDGAQEEKSIVQEEVDKWPNDWSRDGKYIVYTRGTDLWFLTFPELKSRLFLKAPSVFRNGQFSPDGKWVAYASNETGKWQIYVTSFPDARGKWQVSTGGGEQPRWRGDGKELFFLSSDSKMMAAPVTTGANFDSGTPVALFQTTPRQPISLNDQFVYDVRRDGQRFLVNTPTKQAETAPMSVVLNWTAKLNK